MVASGVLIVVVFNFIRMRKLGYTKDDTHSTLALAITEEQEEDLISSTPEVMQEQSSAPEYTPTATETLQPDLFIVISGGEKRERIYLGPLERRGYQRLLIDFIPPQGKKSGRNQNHHLGSAPDDIYSYWLDHYDEDTRRFSLDDDKAYHLEDIDQIFLLTDLDNFRPQLKKLLSISPNAQYRWIISNPCFEIWLYYSYIDSSPTEYLKELLPLSEEKRPAKLKYLLPKLGIKGGADPRKAFLNIDTAIINARQHNRDVNEDNKDTAITNEHKHNCPVDEDNIPKLFCTQMDFLAEQIWARISSEMVTKRADSFKKQLRNKQ